MKLTWISATPGWECERSYDLLNAVSRILPISRTDVHTQMVELPPLWRPLGKYQRETPFRTGIRRALTQAIPLVMNEALPARLKTALQALVELDPDVSEAPKLGCAG